MSQKSLRFKFLRCLVLCVGLIANPSSLMAQVAVLADEPTDIPDSDYGLDPVEVEEIDPSASTIPQSGELTFEFITPEDTDLNDTDTAINANPEDPNSVIIQEADIEQREISQSKKSKKKSKKSKKFKKQSKKFKRKSKKFKKGKKFKKYCSLFFEGTVNKGTEFTAAGNFSSATLIQVFDDKDSYLSGSSAIQTIEYSTASTEVVSVGDQIGSLTVKTSQTEQLTFQYLSTEDTDYTDVVIANTTKGYGAVSGVVDGNDEAYIVVSDGRRGKKCKKFKRVRKCKKGKKLAIQGDMIAGGKYIESVDCSSDTLVQIFDDAPEFIYPDVRKSYWASRFIYRLSSLQIVQGFPDRDFLPESAITQAQYAAIVSKAFNVSRVRQAAFVESIPIDYWAHGNLQTAYAMGFIDITSRNFRVDQQLTKLSVLTSIAKGLGYTQITSGRSVEEILSIFSDANTIPSSDRVYIAALVEKGMLVNYPNVKTLNLNRVISRAETCALIHQALVGLGEFESISSDFIAQ